MNKQEFLAQLRERLSGLPQEDIEERLSFYGEMIDDRMEEGLSEEEAVAAIGLVEEIAAQAVAEIPLAKIARERMRPKRRLSAWEILLLALGSPLWLSLGLAVFAVLFALVLSLWAVVLSLWAVDVSLGACTLGGVLACVLFAAGGNRASGLAVLAAGCVCAGLAIFLFFGCRAATKGFWYFMKKTGVWTKRCLIRKEEA